MMDKQKPNLFLVNRFSTSRSNSTIDNNNTKSQNKKYLGWESTLVHHVQGFWERSWTC